MGRVSFGIHDVEFEDKSTAYLPFIKIEGDFGSVEFQATKVFKDEKMARAAIDATYMILAGPQKNVQHSENGDLDDYMFDKNKRGQ